MSVTRTANVFDPAVTVDVSHDDRLFYRITVRGATPGQFSLRDAQINSAIWSDANGPTATSPNFVFEREWPGPADAVHAQTSHTLGFNFLGVVEMKYEVELRHALGSMRKIFDIDYKSDDAADSFFEPLTVTTV